MAASGGRLDRPNSCSFCIPTYNPRDHDEYRRVGKACALSFGKDTFECLQQYTNGKFQITFRNHATVLSACASGLKYNNLVYPVTPVQDNTTVVYVRFAHYELSKAALHSALLPFGDIVSSDHVMIQEEWGSYASGTRKVLMKMKKPVPNYLKIGSSTIMTSYRGVTKTCRRCEAPDHVASDCIAEINCTRCGKDGHLSTNCATRATPANGKSFADAARAGTSWADQMDIVDEFGLPEILSLPANTTELIPVTNTTVPSPAPKEPHPTSSTTQPLPVAKMAEKTPANTTREPTRATPENKMQPKSQPPSSPPKPQIRPSVFANDQHTLEEDLQMSSDYSDNEPDAALTESSNGRLVPGFYPSSQEVPLKKRKSKPTKKTTHASDFLAKNATLPPADASTDEEGFTKVGTKKSRKSPTNSTYPG